MKYLHLNILLILSFITGCATTTVTDQYPQVNEAIALQKEAINDPLFKEILTELESKNAIDWKDNRTSSVKEDLSAYTTNLAWALEQFSVRGPYTNDSVYLWRKWNPLSSTTAVTTTCDNSTKLNKWKLSRDNLAIANTLVHERGHSFCLTHPTQDRHTNQCDFAYISGDLAESILAHKRGLKHRNFIVPMCLELCNSLKSRGMPHGCSEIQRTH
jgi:hypothetical protein